MEQLRHFAFDVDRGFPEPSFTEVISLNRRDVLRHVQLFAGHRPSPSAGLSLWVREVPQWPQPPDGPGRRRGGCEPSAEKYQETGRPSPPDP